jgi:MiaB/RimO family radical SAM methylthiotransferase
MKNVAESNGYQFTLDPKSADLIVFNTCAFKKKQEDLCVKKIKKYEDIKKDGAEIVVCGCLVDINRERLDNVFNGTSFGPTQLKTFYDVIDHPTPETVEEAHHITREISDSEMFGTRAFIEKIYAVKDFFKRKFHIRILPNFNLFDYIGDENTLYVRISRGCLNQCGYCAIRYAQGKLQSRPADTILKTVEEGIAEGYDKIFLIGTNTSHYGKDIGSSFFDLLEEILKIEGDYKIIVHNFEPFGMLEYPERFIELFSSPKILSFYCPINSGSQHVLDRMRRGYKIERVIDLLGKLKETNPKILIRSEFIVGYPGERWKDFWRTVSVCMRFKFDQIDLHCYSPRPNIYSNTLDKQVALPIRLSRLILIHLFVFFKVSIRKLRPV